MTRPLITIYWTAVITAALFAAYFTLTEGLTSLLCALWVAVAAAAWHCNSLSSRINDAETARLNRESLDAPLTAAETARQKERSAPPYEGVVGVEDSRGQTLFRSVTAASLWLDITAERLRDAIDATKGILKGNILKEINERRGTDYKDIRGIGTVPDVLTGATFGGFAPDCVFFQDDIRKIGNPEFFAAKTKTGRVIAFRNEAAAGAYFGVKEATVKGWRRRGRIPGHHDMQGFLAIDPEHPSLNRP